MKNGTRLCAIAARVPGRRAVMSLYGIRECRRWQNRVIWGLLRSPNVERQPRLSAVARRSRPPNFIIDKEAGAAERVRVLAFPPRRRRRRRRRSRVARPLRRSRVLVPEKRVTTMFRTRVCRRVIQMRIELRA